MSLDITTLSLAKKYTDSKPGATDSQISMAVNQYIQDNPIKPGASPEESSQIQSNSENIKRLKKDLLLYSPGIITKAIGTGNMTVQDAVDTPIIRLRIASNSEQTTTKGLQMLDVNTLANKLVNANTGAETVNSIWVATDYIPVVAGQQYRLTTNGNKYLNYALFFDANKNIKEAAGLSLIQNAGLFTVPGDASFTRIRFYNGGNDLPISAVIDSNPMLNLGAMAQPYEPYTGRNPSPSPEYLQPISGTGTVTMGAQLLSDNALSTGYLVGADGKKDPNSIYRTIWINLSAGTYTFSVSGGAMIVKTVIDGVFSNNSTSIMNGAGYSCTLTQDGYLGISFRRQDSSGYTTEPKVMLNAGSMAKPWESYTGGKPSPSPDYPQPLEFTVTGAQLMDTSKMARTHNDVIFAVREDGSILVTGNTLQNAANSAVTSTNLSPGTYYVSGSVPIDNSKIFVKAKKWYSDGSSVVINDTSFVVDGTETKIDYFIQLYQGLSDFSIVVYPMLNIGDVAMPYEPYHSKAATIQLTSPLYAVEDHKDEITMTKRINRCVELVFDGSENWAAISTYEGFYYAGILPFSAMRRAGFCNQFQVDTEGKTIESVRIGNGNSVLFCVYSRFYDDAAADKGLSAWKTHLASHPLRIVTYLDTPIETDLDADAIAALADLTTYKSTTHLDVAAGGPEPDITMEYIADIKTYIANEHARMKAECDKQIAAILALLPVETQAAMINNETNNLLAESEV